MEEVGTEALDRLRSAKRVGLVLSGGSARCAFQVGAIEVLTELGVRPDLCIGVSGGSWNAAAVAAGTGHRLRYYWRAFSRMPGFDVRNLLREHSPFRWSELHRRTFERYVGAARLLAPAALPLVIGVTRVSDRQSVLFEAREVEEPLDLLLASNYLPPFYTYAPRIAGELYADGGLSDNMPYREAFARGCDAAVLVTMKGESEGGLFRNPREIDHVIPEELRERVLVIRPRHRIPVAFLERRWSTLRRMIELGRIRAREELLGERHPESDVRLGGVAPTLRLLRLLR